MFLAKGHDDIDKLKCPYFGRFSVKYLDALARCAFEMMLIIR